MTLWIFYYSILQQIHSHSHCLASLMMIIEMHWIEFKILKNFVENFTFHKFFMTENDDEGKTEKKSKKKCQRSA